MKKRREDGGGDSWLNTYADMVTLLLTFFAVLISMSSVNEEKFNAFIQSFSNLPQEVIEEIISGGAGGGEGTGTGAEFSEQEAMDVLYEYIKEYVEQNDNSGVIELSQQNGLLYIRFNTALLFEPDQYILTPESYPTLAYIGEGLKQYEDSIKMVAVIGHTADPMDGEERNSGWMLSGERASSICSYFEYDMGFEPTKLVSLGYGKHFPIADNLTESSRQLNRRVEIIVVSNDSGQDVGMYDMLRDFYDPSENPTEGTQDELFEQLRNNEGGNS